MAMNKVPTLVVGIGGIGCRMAANVADLLSAEDREYVGIVGLDTNVNDLKQLKKRGLRTIQTSDDRTVRDYMSEHFFSTSWFPLDRFTAGKSLYNGAGQIRAVSRLAAIAAEEQGKFMPIKEEIQRIRKDNGQLTVMVVGSITGGTGAGLFLQLPYYLRKVLHDASGKNDIIIRGMFIGPDMTADVQPSKINRDAVHVNGYACLKELNALYLRENGMPGIAPLKVDFYEPSSKEEMEFKKSQILKQMGSGYDADEDWAVKNSDAAILAAGNPSLPYDYIYLIESSYAEGTIGNAELTNVEELVGRMVHTLMFSPVRENALSVEDNMVLQDMATRGMNRYSSAGICRLVYPMEIAREYVTLATVRDMVRDEWLALDERYKATVAAIRDEQQSNSYAKIPSVSEAYCKNFEEIVGGGESSLGRLAVEAFNENEEGQKISKAEELINWLDEKILDATEAETIKKARNECAIKPGDMLSAETATTTVDNKRRALVKFEAAAKNAIAAHATIANELFPPAWSILSESKKSPETQKNIYSLLYNVHPITARYICYKLIERLDEILKEKEDYFTGINLSSYIREEKLRDYDSSKKDVQSVNEAIADVSSIPYFAIVSSYVKKNKLQKIAKKFTQGVNKQCQNIQDYLECSLYINVCKLLKNRLEMLSENYRIFFESISDKIKFNDARIAHLEKMNLPLGQIGVYCSKEALECIAGEFKNKNDGEMQKDTKTAIFEQLYHVFDKEYANRSKVLTEKQKEKDVQIKLNTLCQIFETAVVDTVRTSVVENGLGIVDITIRQALEKEYELVMPEGVSVDQYVQNKVEEAMIQAAPMLTVDTNAMAENTQTVYMAMHPDCAEVQISTDGLSAKPSAAATQQKLIPEIGAATNNLRPTVLLNESFSAYEITCFKARYKFAVEDLVKYRDGSPAERCYRERISKLGSSPLNTGNPDDGLTVVPPHLDRYWHEEAYLPALSSKARVRDEMELSHAFIYALGTDFFMRQKGEALLNNETGEALLGWYYSIGGGLESPLKVKGTPVGTTYVELFRALPYLGQIKRHIIREKADDSLIDGMKYPSMEEREAHLLENEFISDLAQQTNTVAVKDKDAEGNIFDIFLEMRGSMDAVEWKKLFDALLYVLQDYCKGLYSYSTAGSSAVPIINRSVRKVLEEILKNSQIGGKQPEEIEDFGEKDLYKHYDRIHKEVFNG